MIDYAAWLKDPAAVRIVLIEVGVKSAGSPMTRYLSTRHYVTSPTDSPANQYYEPVVTTGIQFTESIGIDGGGSFSLGDIEINNFTGERDGWLDDIWDNQPVKAWIGDASWARGDFQMIFNGIVTTIGSKSRDVLNLSLSDKLQRLNTPVTDAKIGGTGTNKDNILNLTFGEAHNVSPQLSNDVTLEYQVHDSAINGLIEVRDNGRPIANSSIGWANVTVNNATGRFTLAHASAGTITASVQGDAYGATYRSTIATLVRRITTGYGTASSRFTDADIDLTNFSTFDANCTQAVGTYAESGSNVLDLCNSLAASVGAQLVMSRAGQLRLFQLAMPQTGASTVAIGPAQMVERSLQISSRPLVKASVMLGFNKNYTVQDGLLTSIPDLHKTLFATEWLTATATSAQVQADYKLNAAPEQTDTMLLRRLDADPEAHRQLALWSVPRTVFQFEGTSELLATLELGTAVTLTNSRFGLSNGKPGIVVSLAPNWLNGHVVVQVLV